MGFKYNGLHSDNFGIYVLRKRRRLLPPITPRLLTVPGRGGAYYQGYEVGVREIEVDILVKAASPTSLRSTVRAIAAWLQPGDQPRDLVFDDEPNLTWRAIVSGDVDLEELVAVGKGTLTFVCPDPVAVGSEVTVPITDGTQVNAGGTAPTWPILRATVNQPITYLAVAVAEVDQYVLLGRPPATEETPAPREELMLHDDCNSLTGWVPAGSSAVINGAVAGAMVAVSGEFRATDYGAGSGWHGPAYKRDLPTAIQDFKLRVRVKQNNKSGKTGRAEVMLLDANGRIAAMISVRDRWIDAQKVEASAYVGNSAGVKNVFVGYAQNPQYWNGYDGFMQIERVGQQWHFRWGLIDPVTGREHTRLPFPWYDAAGAYLDQVRTVVVWLSTYGMNQATDQSFKQIDVWRINSLTATQVPYIAAPGDVVEIDCERHGVFLNGEPRMDLLDPGSVFFRLTPGQPLTFGVAPAAGEVTTELTYRERWL